MKYCSLFLCASFLAASIGFERDDSTARSLAEVNITITQGKTAILPCDVHTDRKDVQVIWMNAKKILISKDESRYIDDSRMSIERPFIGDWNLHIRRVRYEDRGEYTCTVNTKPIYTKRIRLIVQVPAEILDYASTPMSIQVNENENVHLWCNATGVPTPAVTWYRREDIAFIDYKKVGNDGEQLIIKNISRHCGGLYKCMAYNGVEPAVTREIEVKVLFPPEVKVHAKRMGQYRSKETILECFISASPQGENYWRKGNNEFLRLTKGLNYRTEIYEEGPYRISLSLRLREVQEEDFGVYTCQAKNQLGYAYDEIELYELFPPTTRPTPSTPSVRKTTALMYYPTRAQIRPQDRYDQPVSDGSGYPHYPYNTPAPLGDRGREGLYRKNGKHITGHMGTGQSDINNGSSSYRADVISLLILTLIFAVSQTCHCSGIL